MAGEDFNPSKAIVTKAVVFPYFGNMEEDEGINLLPLITQVGFTQTINSSVQGNLYITDKVGVIDKLRGEEKLLLNVKAFDLDYEIKLKLQIYKIDNVEPDKNLDGMSYIVSFITQQSFEANKKKITKPFIEKEASYIVEKVFKEYYGDLDSSTLADTGEELPFDGKKYKIKDTKPKKLFYIQPTDGLFRVVIPNYSPADTMDFMCKKAYSQKTPSSMYRFFETFTNYYFATDEFLITKAAKNPSQIHEMTFNPFTPLDGQDPMEQVNAIESFSNPSRVDTAMDMYSGGYMNKVGEIDFIRRNYTETYYSYKDDGIYYNMEGDKMNIKDNIHTEAFMDENFNENNAKHLLVFRDFRRPGDLPSQVRGDQYYKEIASRRLIWDHHIKNNAVGIQLKGRLDIEPGHMIKVLVPEMKVEETKKKKLSEQYGGNYFVQAVSHIIQDDVLNTSMTLYKFDWS